MEYPVKPAEMKKLVAGQRIRAVVNVAEDGSYDLDHIQIDPAAAKDAQPAAK